MSMAATERVSWEGQGGIAAGGPAGEAFAHFLACTGHRVLRGAGTYWYDASPGFFLSLPSHRLLAPSAEELRGLLRHQPIAGIRFPAPLEGPGKLSYQIVCDTRGYGLDSLSGNARSKVRRGLRRCAVAPVAFSAIAAEGVAADRDTLARQGREVRLPGAAWHRYWEAAAVTPGMEGWAVYVGGSMAAFLISVQFDDSVEFLLARSRSDCLDAYPNNALIFEVAREMLGRRGLRQITFGLESLEPVGPLDQFKFGMGFRAAPLRQRVVFHPLLRVLLQPRAPRAWVCRFAEGRGTASGFWRKALGLLRFA
jgi:Acetyltransferase (GNAT) domain